VIFGTVNELGYGHLPVSNFFNRLWYQIFNMMLMQCNVLTAAGFCSADW